MSTHLKLTMLIEKGLDGWYVGQIQEIPGVLTQGKTIRETKENLVDAYTMYGKADRRPPNKFQFL